MVDLISDIETDDLSGWYLQLLVNTGLQVLVEQSFELLVLLIQQTCLFDEVLSVDKELVVFAEGLIERLPHRKLLVSQNLSHGGPVYALLLLLSARVARLISRFRVLALLIVLVLLVVHHLLVKVAVLSRLMELL